MGPRHEGRGEPPRSDRRSATRADLHGGHGTKAVENAPAAAGVVHGLSTRPLQWGHGTKAVENPGHQQAADRRVVASMGPRHEGRGEPPAWPRTMTPTWRFNGATAR